MKCVSLVVMVLVGAALAQNVWSDRTDRSDFLQDRIVVKFRTEVRLAEQGGSLVTGSAALDELNQRWQMTGYRMVFPGEDNHLARKMGLGRVYVLVARGPIDCRQQSTSTKLRASSSTRSRTVSPMAWPSPMIPIITSNGR